MFFMNNSKQLINTHAKKHNMFTINNLVITGNYIRGLSHRTLGLVGDDREALWSSWAISGPERNFFFSGDTGYFDGFARIGEALGPFDLAAVPIGAYEPVKMMQDSHMNPEEAVRAALDLTADKAVAMHFGTFDLSDEPLDEPPRRFLEAAETSRLGADGAWVLQIGETRQF